MFSVFKNIDSLQYTAHMLLFSCAMGCVNCSYVHAFSQQPSQSVTYPIVDTNQSTCFGVKSKLLQCPKDHNAAFGQDAQYKGINPSYLVHSNGTVTDTNTGLIWSQTTDINQDGEIDVNDKLSFSAAKMYAENSTLGGYSDWRIPTIKELYSLIMFDGEDPSGIAGKSGNIDIRPFIHHEVFGFNSGDMNAGERIIDSQYVTSTRYVATPNKTKGLVFGVNFIDGRIKGYGLQSPRGGDKTFYVLLVRGRTDYGFNDFEHAKDVVTDKATGLTWQQLDNQHALDWPNALAYCESLELAGHKDWRLPNAKELQSIVDYSRSILTSNSASINPLFYTSQITNENQQRDFPNYWSSTTHQSLRGGANAVYIAFGRSLGYMQGKWQDVHGAGAQRSDPKIINGQDYSKGHGPQGDAIRIFNYVRCVRGGNAEFVEQPEQLARATKTYNLQQNIASHNRQHQIHEKLSGKELMSLMDSNRDGKLSHAEVHGPLVQDFERFDLNNDGYLINDELP